MFLALGAGNLVTYKTEKNVFLHGTHISVIKKDNKVYKVNDIFDSDKG